MANNKKINKRNAKQTFLTHEIIIGLVAGVGTDLERVTNKLQECISPTKYSVIQVNVSELLKTKNNTSTSNNKQLEENINKKIKMCNNVREKSARNDAMAILSAAKIRQIRSSQNTDTVYIIRQLKHPDEIKTLRKIYGKNFILLSIFEHDEKRREFLLRHNLNKETKIDELLNRDQSENIPFGQNTRKAFVEADYFVAMEKLDESIARFTKILFGYPYHTPSKDELNMSVAWIAACRSADLSRQVGAAIANEQGDILATGCNDVPKFGGGMFWENDNPDYRDFQKGEDPNDAKKEECIKQFIKTVSKKHKNQKYIEKTYNTAKNKLNNKSNNIYDIIEYHRAVHGEEAAICDAARRGVSTKNTILYCTTFPCHLCTKHIIAAGIRKVIYIHPYPKSQTDDLFNDLVVINPHKTHIDKVVFVSFMGVAPRRMLKVFSFDPDTRKTDDNKKIKWRINESASPFLFNRTPIAYYDKETAFLNELASKKIRSLILKELSDILRSAQTNFNKWNDSKKSWSRLEAEPPSKSK